MDPPHFSVVQSCSLQILQFLHVQIREPVGDRITLGEESKLTKPFCLRPQGLAAAFSATVTKTGQGKKKRGEERREMGRAGPTPSSCRFLPMSLGGPESRAAAPGRPAGEVGLDTLLLQGCKIGSG